MVRRTHAQKPPCADDDAVAPQAQRSRAEAVAKLRPLTTGDIADIVARYAYSSGGPPESVSDLLELRGVSRACAAAVAHSLGAALNMIESHRRTGSGFLLSPEHARIDLPFGTSMVLSVDEELRPGPLVLLAELCRSFATYDAQPSLTHLHVSHDFDAALSDPCCNREGTNGTHAAAASLFSAMMQQPERYFRGVTALALEYLDPRLPAPLLAAMALTPRAASLTSLTLIGSDCAHSGDASSCGADVAPFIGAFTSLRELKMSNIRFGLHPANLAKLKQLTKLRRFDLDKVGDGRGCVPSLSSCRALSTVLASLPLLEDVRLGVPRDVGGLRESRKAVRALVEPFLSRQHADRAPLKKFEIFDEGYDFLHRDVDARCSVVVASLMAAHPHLTHVRCGPVSNPDLATLVSLKPAWLRQATELAVAHPRGELRPALIHQLATLAPELVRLTLDYRTPTCCDSDSSSDDDAAVSWNAAVATAVRDGFPNLAEVTVRAWYTDVAEDASDAALEAIAGPRWKQLRVPLTGTPASAAALRLCTGVSQVRNGVEYPASI